MLTGSGWDEGVTQMKVGEKATLDITRYAIPWSCNRVCKNRLTDLLAVITATVPGMFSALSDHASSCKRKCSHMNEHIRLMLPFSLEYSVEDICWQLLTAASLVTSPPTLTSSCKYLMLHSFIHSFKRGLGSWRFNYSDVHLKQVN